MKSIVRFVNKDNWDHPTFISTNEIHSQSYKTFSRLASKLQAEFPDSFLNVYQTPNDVIYVKTSTYKDVLFPNGLYEIKWNPICKKNSKEKRYVIIKLLGLKQIEEESDDVYLF